MTLDKQSWGFRRRASLSDILTMEEILATFASTVRCVCVRACECVCVYKYVMCMFSIVLCIIFDIYEHLLNFLSSFADAISN